MGKSNNELVRLIDQVLSANDQLSETSRNTLKQVRDQLIRSDDSQKKDNTSLEKAIHKLIRWFLDDFWDD